MAQIGVVDGDQFAPTEEHIVQLLRRKEGNPNYEHGYIRESRLYDHNPQQLYGK